MAPTTRSHDKAVRSLSKEKEAACSADFLTIFLPFTKDIQGPDELLQSQCSEFYSFLELPNEIIAMVMGHMDCYDLLNLLQTSDRLKQVFVAQSTAIFRSIESIRFPEFSGWFGDMPSFMPTTGNPISRTRKQDEVVKDALAYSYGLQQLSFLELSPTEEIPDLTEEEIRHLRFKKAINLVNAGGWAYLAFLKAVQRTIYSDALVLHQYLSTRPTTDTTVEWDIDTVRKTMTSLSQMCWNPLQCTDPDERFYTLIKERAKVYCPPSTEIRRLVLSVCDSVSADLLSRINFRPTFEKWENEYKAARAASQIPMLDDNGIRAVASKIATSVTFQTIFSYGILLAIQLIDEEDLDWIHHETLIEEFFMHLAERLRLDKIGQEHILCHYALEGYIWAKELEYEKLIF